ncbi:MAG: hypothetical protein COA66_06915 [Arcobacter sp.]|nr:hypothetical protein [Campylobacteraceae bacterium]PHR72436.1 MAG: hypothetical protein COA66_06915 [Arcobacter sp.]
MNIVEQIQKQINKLKYDYSKLQGENEVLRKRLENMENKNDEFLRHNQDMLLKIDSTLTLTKGK